MPVFSKCYCQFLGNDSVLLELKMSQDVLNNYIIPEDLSKIRIRLISKSLNKLQKEMSSFILCRFSLNVIVSFLGMILSF